MPYRDPIKQKAAARAWYERNKALTRQRAVAWKKANPEKVRDSRKRSRSKYQQTYAQQHQTLIRAQQRAWVAANREAINLARREERAKASALRAAARVDRIEAKRPVVKPMALEPDQTPIPAQQPVEHIIQRRGDQYCYCSCGAKLIACITAEQFARHCSKSV